ncbi:MAG: aspartate aminotransferase family protein [Hyphomicrobiaceae bacterium]|nr:aspartate aminotransferase family protein [Hyphomicrobiaceae bacterium]
MTSHILHRQTKKPLPTVDKGEGVYLFDTEGNRYLDGSGGAAVSCLGHGHPRVVQAIKEQVDRVAFAHTSFFTNKPAEELADFLCARVPGDFGRVALVAGGSEAMEAALKISRQAHIERGDEKRTHFIARRQSYHGATLGVMSVGYHAQRREPFRAMLSQNTSHISPAYAYRHQEPDESAEEYGLRAARELEDEIQRVGPQNVAAFVAETVSGSSLGVVPPPPGYFREIRRICDEHGVMLILDEVMSGMGRTGTLFACEQDGIEPDIVAVAKGLGAGYQPIGATLVASKYAEAIVSGSGMLKHTHTYMAHPTACAAALAVQTVIEEDDLLPQVCARGETAMKLLRDRLGQHAHVGDIRGRGLFIGIELVADRETKEPFEPDLNVAGRVKQTAFENGLICYPNATNADGVRGDHVLLAPPFIISEDELAELTDKLAKSLDEAVSTVN